MGSDSLRIGCVQYLNARPLIHGWPEKVIIDHPSNLCARLAAGELDVALVSSFEFLRNPIYSIVDGVAIASDGPVYSVVVAHRREIPDVGQIDLDPASETSVNLLRILSAERRFKWHRHLADEAIDEHRQDADATRARLLIGDQAIRFRAKHPEFQFFDLGEEWQALTGVPFVYALWLVRPEVTETEGIAEKLRALRNENLQNLDTVIETVGEFTAEFCEYYYRECIRFGFGPREKEGLITFQHLCEKHEILPARVLELRLV